MAKKRIETLVAEKTSERLVMYVTPSELEQLKRDFRLSPHQTWSTYLRIMVMTWLTFREKNRITLVGQSEFRRKIPNHSSPKVGEVARSDGGV